MPSFANVTTKDVLAVLVVGATMVFAGIAQLNGKPIDAMTAGLSGAIIMHYFGPKRESAAPEEPLPEPATGDGDTLGD